MVRKKKQEDGTHRLGCVFQGEKNIYESNLKHARPRADFKNGNSKEKELIRNMVISGIFPSWSMPSKKGSKMRQAEAIPFFLAKTKRAIYMLIDSCVMAVDQKILNGNCLTWNTLVNTDMHEQTKWRAPWLIEVERWETPHYPLEVLRGQPIELIQVVSTSEFYVPYFLK